MTGDGLLVVETERFHGPLDLLLHLIRTQDIDIFDIPIARITRQFLEAIEVLADTSVDEAGEFLEMAAVLVRIKARMLLPAPQGEEDHDPRAELVRRLLEYEMIREVANRLRAAENDRGRRFVKGYVQPRPRSGAAQAPLSVTWEDVLAAALRVEAAGDRDVAHTVATRRVAMREKVGLIVNTVRRARRIEFASLVAPWRERMHGVMTLLAGLELGRRRVVSLRQREHFSPLWFYRGRNLDDGSGGSVLGAALGAGGEGPGARAGGDGADRGAAGAGEGAG
ncbi:MAG: segregation/condensation protein A [Gemmatimonadota bacterium]|nr:segregation/condensation protein A [Gemmatimonadota bacterium]MDE2985936.1 segregation/condensation protein A [Gemmatimonadota bacterium]